MNNCLTRLKIKVTYSTCRWNFAFKAQITALQQQTRSRSSSTKRAEVQADLNLFLEAALGFYMQVTSSFDKYPKLQSFRISQVH